MGLFDRKETGTTVSPAIAECDGQLVRLEQQKKDVIYRIGEKYVAYNTAKAAAGTPYEADLKELEAITQDIILTEKRKLALQGLRKCDKCGNILVSDSAFCNKCGEKLEPLQAEVTKNICPHCGNPFEDGAVFCTICGNKL